MMKRLTPMTIAIVFGAWTAIRVFAADAVVEPRTEAAVLAADDDWLAAELRGDVKALDARLMPTYRDVTPEGQSKLACSSICRKCPDACTPSKNLRPDTCGARPDRCSGPFNR
jgi:hypothetical protein